MKTFFLWIITLLIIFSSFNTTKANLSIWELLDLQFWTQSFELNLSNIKRYDFKNQSMINFNNTLIRQNDFLKREIERKYRNNEITKTRMNWIIRNHKQFVEHSNFYLQMLEMIDNNPRLINDDEMIYSIIDLRKSIQTYYRNMWIIILNR